MALTSHKLMYFWNLSPISCDEKDMACILKVTFGTLFNDEQCANIFEALVGTLRAGKKRKVVAYDGELLLQGVHDNVEITLKPTDAPVKS
ncbi:costars family protein isoform X1 [Prosopis cineraria]|uniref:costars family protein isoform X1 n=1 Tax=Prosopis cineraria TaxID=364024 RepID=UPI0024102DA1|nr:costars family protein isoform X1 [Prosopis cineraria]